MLKKRIFLAIFAFILLISSVSAVADYYDMTDKYQLFRLNSTTTSTYEQVGQVNKIFNSNPTWGASAWGTGYGNYATGTSDSTYLDTGHFTNGTDTFSVEFRLRVVYPSAGQNHYIWSSGWSGAACDVSHKGIGSDISDSGSITFASCDGSTTKSTTASLNNGGLYHIVWVYNSTLSRIYINGVLTSSLTDTGWTGNSTAGIRLFNRPVDSLAGKGYLGGIDQFVVWKKELTASEIAILNASTSDSFQTSSLSVSLLTPANSAIVTTSSINFSAQLTSAVINITNATIFIWNSSHFLVNNSNISYSNEIFSTTPSWIFSDFPDGLYRWNVRACAGDGNCSFATSNFTFTSSVNSPSINFTSPRGIIPFHSLGKNITINWSVGDLDLDTCWYDFNGLNQTVPCNDKNASVNITTNLVKVMRFYANDSAGSTSVNQSTWDYTIFMNSLDYRNPIIEGALANISNNVSYNTSLYSSTSQVMRFTKFINPISTNTGGGTSLARYSSAETTGNTSITFFFNYSVTNSSGVFYVVSDSYIQNIVALTLDTCGTNKYNVFNFTAYDEDDRSFLNATARNVTIEVDFRLSSLGTTNQFLKFFNTYNYTNPAQLCINQPLNNSEYRMDIIASYEATNAVKELYYNDNTTINSSSLSKNITLYDLLSSRSTSFLFKFKDVNGLKVPNAIIHVQRYYIGSGEFVEVENAKTDNNGEAVVHLVQEDLIYRFNVTLAGREIFLSDQYTAKCLSSPCTISLSAQTAISLPTEEGDIDGLEGGTYAVITNKTARTVSLIFEVNQSTTMNITVFKQDNKQTKTKVAEGGTTGLSGTITLTIPLNYGNTTYYAYVYQNEELIGIHIVDLTEDTKDYFIGIGVFLAFLALLLLALMGISSGEFVIIWVILGFIVVSGLFLLDLGWAGLILICLAGIIILVKLIMRGRT